MTNLTRPDGPLPVTWRGPMLNLSGYASEMRSFVAGLQARGHDVRADSLDPDREFVERSGPAILGSAVAALRSPARSGGLLVQHVPAFAVRRSPDAALVVARTMFETDSLPPSWVDSLNQVDEVWVPTAFNRETFAAAGVRTPIAVVPGGIEADRYHPGVAALPIGRSRSVSFLSVFEWTRRKAVDVLLTAWAAAFGPDDDVELVLRTYPRGRYADPRAELERRLDQQLADIGTSRDRIAPVRILHGALAEEDMPRLYAACDVFVLPTRGEGWGRPYLEAMACGKPVIATDWSAHTDFVDESVGWLLHSAGLVPAAEDLAGSNYDGQGWADPSVEHLIDLLRTAAENEGERARRGAAAATRALDWTWDRAVDVVEDRIAALDQLIRPVRPAGPAANGPAEAAGQRVRVLWRGDVLGSHSFARVNRETLSRLIDDPRFEIAIRTDEPVTRSPWTDPRTATLAGRIGRELSGPADVEVRHTWPPNLAESDAGVVVLQQPWEFGGVPADIARFARQRDEHQPAGADEVWVPTTFVRDGYRDSGVPAHRVQVVPHGVDLDVYHPQGPRHPLKTDKGHRLLFVGGTIWRKGIDLLLDAYAATFTADDDVCLVVKTSLSSTYYRGSNIDDRIRAMAASTDGPAVELIEDDLDDAGLAAVYRACDALVHPFRGEGFALTIIEAMACGLPVVTTGAGAVLDTVDDSTAVLLPATRHPVSIDNDPYGPFVYVPDGGALRATLLQVVEDAAALRPKALRARQVVEQRFTWASVATQVADRLLALHAAAGPVPGGDVEPLPLDSDRSVRLVVDAAMPTPRGRHLLRRYLRTYSARDDVCLAFPLIGDAERDAEVFEQICADLGLDDGSTADVLLVPTQEPGSTRALLAAGDVVLTGGDRGCAALAFDCAKPAFAWPEQVRDLVPAHAD
jgi:glycosyltransferase involved in cell wall biosynthesis